MITRREAKEIVDWVISEINRRSFAYSTDGKLDFNKGWYGTISGTQSSGGPIADGAIWDRHVNDGANIRGTKVRIATTSERGAVELAEDLEVASGIVVQSIDSRLHETTVSGSTEHDVRYYTKDELASGVLYPNYDTRYYRQTVLNSISGAGLIGVEDSNGVFTNSNVEDVLYELTLMLGAQTIISLYDTPDNYPIHAPWYGKVLAVNDDNDGVIWRPQDYIDGGRFSETCSGAIQSHRSYVDGGSFTGYEIIDGGGF